ncbi:MAG: sulfatase [Cyclobacteriaceae bacterium]
MKGRENKIGSLSRNLFRTHWVWVLHFSFLGIIFSCSQADKEHKRPNILLIVSEDNSEDLGAYGNTIVHTPHLDSLAENGVRFSNAYTTYSVCSPSRSSIFTGLYPHQNGQLGWATHHYGLYEGIKVLPQYLKSSGYRIGFLGKIHVNPEDRFNFDFSDLPGSNFQKKNLEEYANNAKKFIDQSEAPYLLIVNFPDAHLPFQNEVDGLPSVKVDTSKINNTLPFVGVNNPRLREVTEAYYNCMNRLDESIGMLFDSIGDISNTCIIYISDHGAQFSRGKLTNYEGGLRIPFILTYPEGIKGKGHVRDELVSVIDILPTILDLTGSEIPTNLPGYSLMELFKDDGQARGWRKYLGSDGEGASPVFYYPRRSIRGEQYKIIHNIDVGRGDFPAFHAYANPDFASGATLEEIAESEEYIREAYALWKNPPEWELYDLKNDPWEFENLAENPSHKGVLSDMQQALLEWRKSTNDPFLDKEKLERYTGEMDSINSLYPDHSYQKVDGFTWNYIDYLNY